MNSSSHALTNQNQSKKAHYFLAKYLEYVNLDGKCLFCEDNQLIQEVEQECESLFFVKSFFTEKNLVFQIIPVNETHRIKKISIIGKAIT